MLKNTRSRLNNPIRLRVIPTKNVAMKDILGMKTKSLRCSLPFAKWLAKSQDCYTTSNVPFFKGKLFLFWFNIFIFIDSCEWYSENANRSGEIHFGFQFLKFRYLCYFFIFLVSCFRYFILIVSLTHYVNG